MGELRKLARRAGNNPRSKRRASAYLLLRRLAALILPGKKKVEIARELSGKSPLKQLLDRLVLFFGYRLDARTYYDFSLFMPDMFSRAGEFQDPSDIALFNSRLNQNDTTRYTEDKQLFQRFCDAHGIPTPATIALLDPGASDKDSLASQLSLRATESGLFFKPQFGFKGAGVGRLSCDGKGQWIVDFGKGERIIGTWDEIYDRLLTADEPLVFQEILENHPLLSQFNPNTLHTLRITTYAEGSDIHILSVILRLGLGNSVTDNVSVGGLAAAVDPETGQLSNGSQDQVEILPLSLRYIGDDEIDLQSIQLPFFREALEMAKSIHANLPKMFSLGHDIAILADGPIAVETNHIWGEFQKFHNVGYGAHRYYISNLINRCQNHPDFS